ncbi:DNA-binding protein H-NS [Candidatus Regiella insecticola 5.15]|uniref:DNA-binding protein n=1 Tax=Candidatus Regiella insecticola 5.15 TaxID=1005043 RepID=G2H015_9ENTR|nr:H-NS family nucleoid-associated regulatory protein [Candidatus Regiella insecticola]EGY28665.1 DNA-binding protein H-NS [Candidatus Regiella insecticola 5.15]
MSEKIYAEMRRILSNIRSLRTFVRESDFEMLEESHAKLGVALEECRADYEAEKSQLAEREKKRLELIKLVKEEGFDISTLAIPVTTGQKKKKSKSPSIIREPKYQFTENGKTQYWAGIGRQPNPIKKTIKAGGSLDDFLIK